MARATNNGRCVFCKGVFSKQTMAKHLAVCEKNKSASKGATEQTVYRLLVEGLQAPEYWLHLEASGSAKLKDLDDLLREVCWNAVGI